MSPETSEITTDLHSQKKTDFKSTWKLCMNTPSFPWTLLILAAMETMPLWTGIQSYDFHCVSDKTKLNEVLVLEEHQISFCFSACTSEKYSYWSIPSHRFILKVTSLWMSELAFGPPTKYQSQLTNIKPYLVSLFWKLQSMISCLCCFRTCKVIQYDRRVVWVNSSPCN